MSPTPAELQWYLFGVVSGAITLLLGVSVIYSGVVILGESRPKTQEELHGLLCLVLGILVCIVGFVWFLLSGAALAYWGI